MVEIRPTMPGDSWLILSSLREREVDELAALGHTSEECIRIGMQCGNAMTLFIAGKPAGIYGVADFGDEQVPWGVFTRAIDQHPIAFLRFTKRWKQSMCGRMVQVVDARNVQAVRWFKWLGFDVSDAAPMGVNGEPFHTVRVS